MNQPQNRDRERREHERKPINLPVEFQFQLPSGRVFGSGRTVNLSRSGVRFRSAHYVPVGTVFELTVGQNKQQFAGKARLVYVEKIPEKAEFLCGAKFLKMER